MEASKVVSNGFKNVLVVGCAFKPGEKLTTNAPGLSYANELYKASVNVTIYDPLVEQSDPTVAKFMKLTDDEFNVDYIEDNFDYVCVAIKQYKVNWDVIKNISKITVAMYCDV